MDTRRGSNRAEDYICGGEGFGVTPEADCHPGRRNHVNSGLLNSAKHFSLNFETSDVFVEADKIIVNACDAGVYVL